MDAFQETDDRSLIIKNKLRQYCSSDDEDIIEEGVNNVKRILADNFVRPDEAQKVLSILWERGSYTVIVEEKSSITQYGELFQYEHSSLGNGLAVTGFTGAVAYIRYKAGSWCGNSRRYKKIFI